MNVKSISKLAILPLMAALGLNAGTSVQVTLEDTSGISDGPNFVLPYILSINGHDVLADCYDFLNTMSVGDTWTANIDTLAEAAASGMFSARPGALQGYELIGVLSLLATSGAQSQIDLQEDMWNVFDPGKFALTSGMASDLSLANAEIPTFDFSSVEFIEPLQGESVQPFVILSTPEPAGWLLIAMALIAMASLLRPRLRLLRPQLLRARLLPHR